MTEYHPDETRAAATFAAYAQLGSEIAALLAEVQAQRERADEYQNAYAGAERNVCKLRIYVDELEIVLHSLDAADHIAPATDRALARVEQALLEGVQ